MKYIKDSSLALKKKNTWGPLIFNSKDPSDPWNLWLISILGYVAVNLKKNLVWGSVRNFGFPFAWDNPKMRWTTYSQQSLFQHTCISLLKPDTADELYNI